MMSITKRIAFFTAPVLVLPVITMVYTHFNIDRNIFVKLFGCGCEPFFNTNHLSLNITGLLLVGTACSWWLAARDLPRGWRWTLAVIFWVGGYAFLIKFLRLNWWL